MTVKQAMEILKKNSLIVTEREAKIILDFLHLLITEIKFDSCWGITKK